MPAEQLKRVVFHDAIIKMQRHEHTGLTFMGPRYIVTRTISDIHASNCRTLLPLKMPLNCSKNIPASSSIPPCQASCWHAAASIRSRQRRNPPYSMPCTGIWYGKRCFTWHCVDADLTGDCNRRRNALHRRFRRPRLLSQHRERNRRRHDILRTFREARFGILWIRCRELAQRKLCLQRCRLSEIL